MITKVFLCIALSLITASSFAKQSATTKRKMPVIAKKKGKNKPLKIRPLKIPDFVKKYYPFLKIENFTQTQVGITKNVEIQLNCAGVKIIIKKLRPKNCKAQVIKMISNPDQRREVIRTCRAYRKTATSLKKQYCTKSK